MEKMVKPFLLMFALLMISSATVISPAPVQNFVVNGDFSQNTCPYVYCVGTSNNLVSNWIPDPEIEIGYAFHYTDSYTAQTERVLELTASKNTCVRQQINLVPVGYYRLQVQYTARKGFSFQDAQFSVSINNILLNTITPTSYGVQAATFDLQATTGCGAELRLCGVGRTDKTNGAVIKSVSLVPIPVGSINLFSRPIIIDAQTGTGVQNPLLPTFPLPTYPYPYPYPYPLPTQPTQPIQPTPTPVQPTPTPVQPTPTPVQPTPTPVLPNVKGYTIQSTGRCTQVQINLVGGGTGQLNFKFEVFGGVNVLSSTLIVTFDDKEIGRVTASKTGQNITIQIGSKITPGVHRIGFCPSPSSNQQAHTYFISGLKLQENECVVQKSGNLVVNGGFESNQCNVHYCVWGPITWREGKVTAWYPNPRIEVGRGSFYNKRFNSGFVAELDSGGNTCIKQNIVLPPGKYEFSLRTAAREIYRLISQGFQAKLNSRVLLSIAEPSDYEIHSYVKQFQLIENYGQSVLEICGLGISNGFGSIVDDVAIVSLNQQKCVQKYTYFL